MLGYNNPMANERGLFVLTGSLTAALIAVGIAVRGDGANITGMSKSDGRLMHNNPSHVRQLNPEEISQIQVNQSLLTENKKANQPEGIWKEGSQPVFISIPRINFESPIQQAKEDRYAPDKMTYLTPETGIATPDNLIGRNMLVFGHSR